MGDIRVIKDKSRFGIGSNYIACSDKILDLPIKEIWVLSIKNNAHVIKK